MDLFGGESSSPGLRSSTSRLTLRNASSSSSSPAPSSPPHSVPVYHKRQREPSTATSAQTQPSNKRVRNSHSRSNREFRHTQNRHSRKVPTLASLQNASSPQVLLRWAHACIHNARVRLPELSSAEHHQLALEHYHVNIRRAFVCLRAIVDETQPTAKAEVTLEAIQTLVELLITDADLKTSPNALHQVKDLIRRGLTAASTDVRYRHFKLSFQELQIRVWTQDSEPSSQKLARNEAKRVAMEFAASTAEPEWAYHWLFLHHSLNTSVNTFDRLITFASQREDQHIVDAVRVMRLQWNLSASRYHASVADYHFLDAHDKSAWPRTLRLYFATLKVAFLAYFSDEKGTLEKTKAALGELHGFFSDASLEAPADAPSSSRPDGTFEIPIQGNNRVQLQAMPLSRINLLLYVLSAALSHDPTGSRPLRFKFLESGLASLQELRQKGFNEAPAGSGPSFLLQDRLWLCRLEADALLLRAEMELTRSAFDACAVSLKECLKLVAHDQPLLWDDYKVSYTLMQGMLYHAVDQSDQALRCYTAVLVMHPNHPLALASISMIRLSRGELKKIVQTPKKSDKSAKSAAAGAAAEQIVGQEMRWLQMPIDKLISETRGHCDAAAVPKLKLASSIIIGATRSGIVKSKHNLSGALTTANNVGLAQVKPLILLLLSNLFSNTRKTAAKDMLQSAFKLSIGMGSQRITKEEKDALSDVERRERAVGNARTGLTAGQELLKVYIEQGEQEKTAKQKQMNEAHQNVLKKREAAWKPRLKPPAGPASRRR